MSQTSPRIIDRGRVVRAGTIPEESSRLSIDHGDALARRLGHELKPGDAVLTQLPSDGRPPRIEPVFIWQTPAE